jgi:serine/threonine-protein kinase
MSAVYLGRRVESEPEHDGPSVVALKIVNHEVAKDGRLVRMFLEEGRLLGRLVHPNIVRTLEVGGDAEQDFIAMELMLGKTFAAIHDALVARNVRLNAEIAAWAAARMADALHYAHELTDDYGRPLALIHRDVNPANVFATFDGEVKLFDFGLAKVTAGEPSGSQLLAGKLSYLSPEQIMQMPLDRRSDIFSLGTTLWELLTSRRLFRRDTDIETVRAVQLGPIPDPRAIAPELPEELARIARTALERNRDHRYPSAAHLARELDAFVFARSSAADVTARLAQLVDTLFPGEHKRQSGWLKPTVTSSISRSMNAVVPPGPGSTTRPTAPGMRVDSGETAVMENMPGPPLSDDDTSSTAPGALREPPRSVFPRASRDGMPSARPPVPSSPPTAARAGPFSTPSAPPAILAPPTPRTARPSQKPSASVPPPPSRRPPVPRANPSSRTDIQTMAPPFEQAPRVTSPDRESMKPGPPGLSAGARPKRAPIPLPSRASVPPKATSSPKTNEGPADSEATDVDMPISPSGGRRGHS